MSSDDSAATSPPADSSTTPPPADSSTTPPPADSSTTPPPADSSTTPPPADSSTTPPPADSSTTPPPPSPDSAPPPPQSTDSPPPPSSDSASPPPPSGNSQTPPPSSGSGNSTSPAPPTSQAQPPPPGSGKKEKSPPKSKGDSPVSSKSDRDSKDNKHKLGDKSDSSNESSIITGAAAGAGLLLLIMILFMISRSNRKKRKKQEHELKYYRDNSNLKNYYNNGPPNWQNRPPNDLMMKMPPHGGMSGDHGWGPPPPPPPMMSSSEMSSAGFSGQAMPPPHPAVAMGFNQSNFTYEDLAAATRGFARENLLGQGGFGYVHKGVLPNGKEIAVKSLKMNSGQGEREFQAEVDIISRVHHRHLVSLVGWCSTGAERLLVYEFVSNGTLEYHLHGSGSPNMDWPTRVKIALGAAKGFAYLHEDCHPRIIHRDIKGANILIDTNFDAKVADFGLAKLSSDNHTHVSTRIMGTFGYLAPEYASSGKLTEKSDVYSFGVMLLELITGRRPIDMNSDSDDDTLVDWARPILMKVTEGGSYEELVDPKLGNNYDHQQMLQMVHCAGAAIKHSARGRPRMSQIVRALEGDVSLEDLNAGSRGSMLSSNGSDFDLKKLGKGGVATSSQEFSSSDEAQTGEFRR